MTNGLETSIAATLWTGALLAFCYELKTETRCHVKSASLFALAALTRPEFFITFPLLLIIVQRKHQRWQNWTVYLLPLLAFEIFRLTYYHDFVPNTYWAKTIPLSAALPMAIKYLRIQACPGGPQLGIVLALFGVWALYRRSYAQEGRTVLIALAAHVVFILRVGGDWMVDGRFCNVVGATFGVLWLGAILQMCAYRNSLTITSTNGKPINGATRLLMDAVPVLIALTLVIIAHVNIARAVEVEINVHDMAYVLHARPSLSRWRIANPNGLLTVGDWLKANAKRGQTALLSEIGLVPLTNPDIKVIDCFGLTDRTIAHMPGYKRATGGVFCLRDWMRPGPLRDYIRKRRPECVALAWDDYVTDNMDNIQLSDAFYEPTGTFPMTTPFGYFTVATWRLRNTGPR